MTCLSRQARASLLVAAFLGLTGWHHQDSQPSFFIAPLFILGGAHYLRAFSAEQLQALALLFLKANDHGAAIALVFFGFYALLTGLPHCQVHLHASHSGRVVGIWRFGLADLPCISRSDTVCSPTLQPSAILGAALLMLWLLVFGVNEQRWKERPAQRCQPIMCLTERHTHRCSRFEVPLRVWLLRQGSRPRKQPDEPARQKRTLEGAASGMKAGAQAIFIQHFA